jgi:hypothetical protein
MEPVNAFLEKRVAARHVLVVAPVVGRFQLVGDRREVRKDHLAKRASRNQRPQLHRERLVMIVFADQHHAPRAIARGDGRLVIVHAQVRRLLDQDVLARGERGERQRQVIARRHGDDDGVDLRVFDGGRMVRTSRRRRGRGRRHPPSRDRGSRSCTRSRSATTSGGGYGRA